MINLTVSQPLQRKLKWPVIALVARLAVKIFSRTLLTRFLSAPKNYSSMRLKSVRRLVSSALILLLMTWRRISVRSRKPRSLTLTISSLGVGIALTTISVAVYVRASLSATTSLSTYGRIYAAYSYSSPWWRPYPSRYYQTSSGMPKNLTLNSNKYKLMTPKPSLMQELLICSPCKVLCNRWQSGQRTMSITLRTPLSK